ncbi:histidinol-phosphatase HisJ [Bacillus sp. B1-b2]|uniref:histidinol-phosphatase HisJ n=1 Tax=Bacillus sp. B1-b2 TaxID=2653201 RepID=UPI001262AB4B|nr:histidinol-phosphatase HisJ [Bacillus sp. B1-b2]KAB7666764.1 histidinol-phosphatase HisJ [Bacillus sp. B1-b2]
MFKRDGHIHSPYCPHGSTDTFVQYIERAIQLGFKEITFTEHAPLPAPFIDTTPTKDSSMTIEQMEEYLKEVQEIKEIYYNQLKINVGLEVDYIEGYETEIRDFLSKWGHLLDDSILSVHFLLNGKNHHYDCVDYSPEHFQEMIGAYGGIDAIYECYYNTILKSILADLGQNKPKRIGHITLANKFQILYPPTNDFREKIVAILKQIKHSGYTLDYNAAGLKKPYCLEPYPPDWVIEEAKKLHIPLVYGSDAHQAKDLGQGYNLLVDRI